MEASKEWGTAPWEIAGGSKLLWYVRFLAYREAINAKAEIDDQMIEGGYRG